MTSLPQLQYRLAIDADIPAMSVIRRSVRENILRDPSKVTIEMYHDYLHHAGRAWVCEYQGKIIGFSYAALADHSIWALFVSPEHEGLGAGKRLLKFACEWLFSQGAKQVQLSTAAGTRADRFYANQGWNRSELPDSRDVKFILPRPIR
ncbi:MULTISPECIES: GNAT family N-acetyltransferase [Undibacterium]|nr:MULTISPECIES: GNAT family N-acetyltransferase [Undibacterium]